MSTYESARSITVEVNVATAGTNPVPAFRFASLSTTAGRRVALTGAGAIPDGVIAEEVDAAAVGTRAAPMVIPHCVVPVQAGGTVTVGANVASNATGQAVVAASGNAIVGKFIEAGASGDVVAVLFTGFKGAVA